MTKMEGYKVYRQIKQDDGYTVKMETLEGKTYLVAPVIMMVEGVHNGSHGPLLHAISELGKFPESWNGIPIVVNHPLEDGMHVSANSPKIIEKEKIGMVFNTYIKDNVKLAAEVWIEEEKLKKISQEVLDNIKAGKPLEVSLGMFTEELSEEGDWNGEHYQAIALNPRPDHLALLPGGVVGACSIADGCGLRVNTDGSTTNVNYSSVQGSTSAPTWTPTTITTPFTWYEAWDPQELIINVKLKEDNQMAEKTACTPCVKTRVDTLIANGRFTEDDREMLETLNEALLDKIAKPIEVEKVVEKTIEVNALSPEDKALLDTYKAQLKEKRNAVIKTIQDNFGKDKWPDEVLADMKDAVLDNIAVLVQKKAPEVVDYSLNGFSGLTANSEGDEAPLPPTGITFK